ncbi:LamG domain-containing protein [Soonwooa purpurea]
MSLFKIGNINIKDVRLDQAEAQKVYLGSSLVWEREVVPTLVPILDLPFQNDFTDLTGTNTMVAGGMSNQPTFELSGRKPGEYCAVFNGSQSIKTTTNLPINSNKVTIAFWIKTTQTKVGNIAELSTDYNLNNAFRSGVNGKITFTTHSTPRYNGGGSSSDINTNVWTHVVLSVDRSLGVNQVKIYVNGALDYIQSPSSVANITENFVNNILFIGQRAGSSLGFNGSLTNLKIYNYPLTAVEVSTLYNSEL